MQKEQLNDLLAKFNISADTLLLKMINATGLTQASIQKLIEMQTPQLVHDEKDVRPGMFLTREGHVSKNYVADETIAMVLGGGKGKVKAMSLNGKELPFSTSNLFVDTVGHDGLDATRLIVAAARKHKLHAEAAEYCQSFALSGLVKKGDAYLLSEDEVKEVQSYFFNIQEALHSVNFTSGCLWSSTMGQNGAMATAAVYSFRSLSICPETVDFPQFVYPAFWVPFRRSC